MLSRYQRSIGVWTARQTVVQLEVQLEGNFDRISRQSAEKISEMFTFDEWRNCRKCDRAHHSRESDIATILCSSLSLWFELFWTIVRHPNHFPTKWNRNLATNHLIVELS
jgi:hypothetical protein